jgi:hypothetical protein
MRSFLPPPSNLALISPPVLLEWGKHMHQPNFDAAKRLLIEAEYRWGSDVDASIGTLRDLKDEVARLTAWLEERYDRLADAQRVLGAS